jgi:DNA-binding CsgD family transcriptional regulator
VEEVITCVETLRNKLGAQTHERPELMQLGLDFIYDSENFMTLPAGEILKKLGSTMAQATLLMRRLRAYDSSPMRNIEDDDQSNHAREHIQPSEEVKDNSALEVEREKLRETKIANLGLARREVRFLELVGSGLKVKEIAVQNCFSINYIYTALGGVYKKIGVTNQQEAKLWAQFNLLGLDSSWEQKIVQNAGVTGSELTVLQMLIQDIKPEDIAKSLSISVSTVLSHKKRIYRKLDVSSAKELKDKVASMSNP